MMNLFANSKVGSSIIAVFASQYIEKLYPSCHYLRTNC